MTAYFWLLFLGASAVLWLAAIVCYWIEDRIAAWRQAQADERALRHWRL